MYEALVARVRYHIQKANFMGLKEAESTLLLGEAADAIEELSCENEILAKSVNEASEILRRRILRRRWIPVTERLPEEYVNVLCHLRSLDRQSEYYSIDHLMEDGQWWKAANSWKHEVTHWMPLPEPPDHIGDANEMVEPPKDGEA